MSKTIEVKLTLNILDNGNLSDEVIVGVDFDEKKIKTLWEMYFVEYLKQTMGEHAQPILFAANNLATLKAENIQYQDCCCD